MKWLDDLYNKREFRRYNVSCASLPVIYGRILIANFAEGGFGKIKIGRDVTINSGLEANPVGGARTVFLFKHKDALIEIGDNTGISNAMIAAYEHVFIGKNVSVGAGVKIMDTDFHPLDLDERMRNVNIPHRPVRIEDGAFIGTEAMILKGVTVGAESVVGAGSTVAKSIPAGEIWAGNPAKFIRKLK